MKPTHQVDSYQVLTHAVCKSMRSTGGGLYKALFEPVMPERQIEEETK